jgi:hypothetical protein
MLCTRKSALKLNCNINQLHTLPLLSERNWELKRPVFICVWAGFSPSIRKAILMVQAGRHYTHTVLICTSLHETEQQPSRCRMYNAWRDNGKACWYILSVTILWGGDGWLLVGRASEVVACVSASLLSCMSTSCHWCLHDQLYSHKHRWVVWVELIERERSGRERSK